VAARAYWKGYLKLSLVSCPIALFPATTEREKISFHQLNKETGNRIRYRKVDAETGDEVPQDNIIKGYEVGKAEYIELDPEELEAVAIESKHTLEIEEFVPKKDIDELYLRDPYYIVPDGDVGQQEVDIYLADLKSRVSAMTVHSRICRLRRAAQYMAPGRDFSWLAEIAKDLAFSHPTKAARL
jgi:DNA end-binding protein Ku